MTAHPIMSDDSFRQKLLVSLGFSMDEIGYMTHEVGYSGGNDTWQAAERLAKHCASNSFVALVESGRSINWFATIIRGQGFAHGRPDSMRSRENGKWLNDEELSGAINRLLRRLRSLPFEKLMQLPDPCNVLYAWLQLGPAGEVKKYFDDNIVHETAFLLAMERLRSWANSTDKGVHHPLHARVVGAFTDAKHAHARLVAISKNTGSHEERATRLLNDWLDEGQF